MTTISRYIARRTLSGIFIAFTVVTAIIMLVDFVEATRTIGDNTNLSFATIAILTIFKTPQLIEQTIPFVVLFGMMGTLFGLNKRSELIVLRASGLSAWRILTPALFVTTSLGVIWAVLFNPLAVLSTAHYKSMVDNTALQYDDKNTKKNQDVWLREGSDNGQIVIHGSLDTKTLNTLKDVTFYYYDFLRYDPEYDLADFEITRESTKFSRRVDADKAVLHPSSYWQLYNLIENKENQILTYGYTASVPTRITFADLKDHAKRKNRPAFWNTAKEIQAADDAGFSSVALQMHFHKLLSLPLMLIAMTFIAASVSMQLIREGGSLRLLLTGGVIGFGVYFSDSLFVAFGEAQSLPVILAAWSIPLLALFAGVSYLMKIEDG
ncbi:MAG: LptF/LptG family permease [Maricaulaceae bacterium]